MNIQLDQDGYASNSMEAIVLAKAADNNAIQSNLNIKNHSSLNSLIYIERNKDSTILGKMIVKRNENYDLYFNLNVKQISDLKSNISITATNRMIGLVEAQHPPIIKRQFIPTKDAFISSKYPTFNSGKSHGLTIGNFQGEIYRTFMGFNLGILQNCVIKSAKLVLKLQNSMDTSIRLLTFLNNWIEEDITWKNQPTTVGLLSNLQIFNNTQEASVDISQYLQNHLDANQYIYNFRLDDNNKTNNRYVSINSRENPYPSYLEIEYYSNEVINYGKIQLNSNIIVEQNKNSDIMSSININRYNDINKLISKITVRRPEILDSNIIVSRDKLISNVIIKKYYNHSIISNIIIKKHIYDELETSITISKPNLLSNMLITYYNNINSFINIRVQAQDEINSNIIIRRIENKELISNINIKNTNDIPSNIFITHDIIFGNVIIRQHSYNNINSNIKVQLHDNNDFEGNITISNPNIKSNIIIKQNSYNNINSNIKVRLYDNNDFEGNIVISNPNIKSNIIIKQNQNYDLINNINIRPASNLSGNIIVTYTDNINSSIDVRNTTGKEIHGKIKITHYNNLESNIIIKQNFNNDLQCSIYIYLDNGYVYIM